MRFAIGFILGAIVTYPIVLFVWVLATDYDRPNAHGLEGMEALAVAYMGLYVVAPLAAMIAGLVLGFLLRNSKPR